MLKKLAALLALLTMVFTFTGCGNNTASESTSTDDASASADSASEATEAEESTDPDVIGINEIDVGDSGPQTNGPLEISLVYFQAIDLEHGSMAMAPASQSDMHFEIDVKTNDEAKEWGYDADQFMPYLQIHAVVTNQETGESTDLGTMMPMIASDGPHYGNNISLEAGKYDVTITVDSPADDFMLHTGKDSSGVKGRFWEEPLKFEFKKLSLIHI